MADHVNSRRTLLPPRERAVTPLAAGGLGDAAGTQRHDELVSTYEAIFRTLPIGLHVWQQDAGRPERLRLVYVNAAGKAAGVGCARVGRALQELFPGRDGAALTALLLEALRSGEVRSKDRFRFEDEELRDVVFTVQALPLAAGRVAVMFENATPRVHAVEAFREAEGRHRQLVESIHAIVWRGDPWTQRFSFVSPEAATLLGYPVRRWIEEPAFWPDHLHPDDRDWVLARRARAADEGRDHQLEFRMIAADGRVVWLRDVVRVLTADGLPRETVGVMFDVTERRRAEEELRRSREQLRDLSARVEWAREEERTTIARAIHDELGQALTALKMDLSWVKARVGTPLPLSQGEGHSSDSGRDGLAAPPLLGKIEDMAALIDDTVERVRRIARELRPGVLDDLGLEAALEWLGQDFEGRTGVGTSVRSTLGDTRVERDAATALFRIAQEALTNVARHARASRVTVLLGRDGGRLSLEVRDDGVGISDETAASTRSLGLLGMRERARRLGGDLTISAAPGRGTVVTVSVAPPKGGAP